MMKDTTGIYDYKGFTLFNKTDYNPYWDIEAGFLVDNFGDTDFIINFITNNRICNENCTTLANTKKYIREHEDELKKSLIERLQQAYKDDIVQACKNNRHDYSLELLAELQANFPANK